MRRTIIAISALATLSSAQAFTPRHLTGPIIEADNGQQYQIEDITPYPGGGVELNLYIHGAPGDVMAPERMLFDCRGRMWEHPAMVYIPPRSVAGRIAQIACAGVKGK